MTNDTCLWPTDLAETLADCRNAQQILMSQAELLPGVTNGAVTARIEADSREDEVEGTRYSLHLVSKDGYAHELLLVLEEHELPYPCELIFEGDFLTCMTPIDLVRVLGEVLGSDSTRSLLLALAVRSRSATVG